MSCRLEWFPFVERFLCAEVKNENTYWLCKVEIGSYVTWQSSGLEVIIINRFVDLHQTICQPLLLIASLLVWNLQVFRWLGRLSCLNKLLFNDRLIYFEASGGQWLTPPLKLLEVVTFFHAPIYLHANVLTYQSLHFLCQDWTNYRLF